jgi:hypothetical protein
MISIVELTQLMLCASLIGILFEPKGTIFFMPCAVVCGTLLYHWNRWPFRRRVKIAQNRVPQEPEASRTVSWADIVEGKHVLLHPYYANEISDQATDIEAQASGSAGQG